MIIKTIKYLIVGVVLVLELLFCLGQGVFLHGPVFDVSYRHEQRVPALWDNYLHPSPSAKARLDEELARMNRYLVLRTLFTVTVFAGIDWIGFRYLEFRTQKDARLRHGSFLDFCQQHPPKTLFALFSPVQNPAHPAPRSASQF